MVLTVQWIGGPFDGTWERVDDEATTFAVAFNELQERVQLPGLQAMMAKKGQLPRHPAVRQVRVITIYSVDTEQKTIRYRENPPLGTHR